MSAGRGHPGIRSITSDAVECPLLDDIRTRPDVVMARGRTLKHDGTTTVAAVTQDGRSWVIKRYNTKNRWHAFRRLFQASRALNCWNAASRLREAGIDTPRPVAALEERRLGLLRGRSYLVCELVRGETLNEVLRREGAGDARQRLVAKASEIVRRLGDAGIVHGDLKATNFIVSDNRIYLADLDAARPESGRRLAAGLRKDLRRFLKNWEDQPELLRAFTDRLAPE